MQVKIFIYELVYPLVFILGVSMFKVQAQIPHIGKGFEVLDTIPNLNGNVVLIHDGLYLLSDTIQLPTHGRRRKFEKFIKKNGYQVINQHHFRLMAKDTAPKPICIDSVMFLPQVLSKLDTIKLSKGKYTYFMANVTFCYFLISIPHTKERFYFEYQLYRRRGESKYYIVTPCCYKR